MMFSYRKRNLTKTEVTLHNLEVSPENTYLYHRTWRNLSGTQLEALTSQLVFIILKGTIQATRRKKYLLSFITMLPGKW